MSVRCACHTEHPWCDMKLCNLLIQQLMILLPLRRRWVLSQGSSGRHPPIISYAVQGRSYDTPLPDFRVTADTHGQCLPVCPVAAFRTPQGQLTALEIRPGNEARWYPGGLDTLQPLSVAGVHAAVYAHGQSKCDNRNMYTAAVPTLVHQNEATAHARILTISRLQPEEPRTSLAEHNA